MFVLFKEYVFLLYLSSLFIIVYVIKFLDNVF